MNQSTISLCKIIFPITLIYRTIFPLLLATTITLVVLPLTLIYIFAYNKYDKYKIYLKITMVPCIMHLLLHTNQSHTRIVLIIIMFFQLFNLNNQAQYLILFHLYLISYNLYFLSFLKSLLILHSFFMLFYSIIFNFCFIILCSINLYELLILSICIIILESLSIMLLMLNYKLNMCRPFFIY